MDLELVSEAEHLAEEAQRFEAFAAINLRNVRGEVSEALKHFGRLGILDEYTKHDITHIDSMLHMYEWLIPDETKNLMTPADWLLLTLSTYLHDFGLLVTKEEYEKRESVEAFVVFRRRIMENDDPSVRDYRSQVSLMNEEEVDRFLYQEFVRSFHAQRIRGWLMPTPDGTWGIDQQVTERLRQVMGSIEETFLDDIGTVCESHHLDDINDTRKYPLNKPYGRTPQEAANVQYAAFMLRTSDLLHITKDRVPSMAAVVINPRNPKSQIEWAKQRAVRSVRAKTRPKNADIPDRQPDTIEVHASFKQSEGYFGLTAYLQYAQGQLEQTFTWSKDNQAEGTSEYAFPWRRVDFSNIEAKGFVTEPFEFSIDQAKILDLLTGHTLYNDTGVVVRELVQNSLDAVRLQAHIDPEGYQPRIDVAWSSDSRTLRVTDNGVGMNQSTIERNFLRVGSSKYQDPEFRREYPEFSSISRFGIGVLSAFMVADDVSVSTSHPSEGKARQLSLRDVHGQYLVRLLDKNSSDLPKEIEAHGTSVVLKLRPSARLSEVMGLLQSWIVIPDCEVWLSLNDAEPVRIGFESVGEALRQMLIDVDMIRDVDGQLQGPYGQPVEIRTVHDDGLELAFAVQWSRWLEEWGYMRFDPRRQEDDDNAPPVQFGVCVGGVRVTTEPPGFRYGGVAAMANTFGKSAPLTNVARSSLERTDEYENLLRKTYAGFVGHILDEMNELESVRGATLTKAAHEASYLAQELVRFEVESPDILQRVLRTIPALVLEEAGNRKRVSLEELRQIDSLSSIESATITSFEGVLRSVRGAASPSLKNLIDALGSEESIPDTPVIFGLENGGLLTSMFTDEWEVVRLESDNDSRTLRTTWSPVGEAPRWERVTRRPTLPMLAASRLDRETAIGRSSSDLSWVLFPASGNIDVVGIPNTLVSSQGRLLVLPGNEFLKIEAVSPQVTPTAKNWCVAWLLASVTGLHQGRTRLGQLGGQFYTQAPPDARSDRWISRVLEQLRDFGLLEVLEEGSVREALADADIEALDVRRWDTRRREN